MCLVDHLVCRPLGDLHSVLEATTGWPTPRPGQSRRHSGVPFLEECRQVVLPFWRELDVHDCTVVGVLSELRTRVVLTDVVEYVPLDVFGLDPTSELLRRVDLLKDVVSVRDQARGLRLKGFLLLGHVLQ